MRLWKDVGPEETEQAMDVTRRIPGELYASLNKKPDPDSLDAHIVFDLASGRMGGA
jgi:hypothetical protein